MVTAWKWKEAFLPKNGGAMYGWFFILWMGIMVLECIFLLPVAAKHRKILPRRQILGRFVRMHPRGEKTVRSQRGKFAGADAFQKIPADGGEPQLHRFGIRQGESARSAIQVVGDPVQILRRGVLAGKVEVGVVELHLSQFRSQSIRHAP